jgi:hypothetical protein
MLSIVRLSAVVVPAVPELVIVSFVHDTPINTPKILEV